MNTRLSCLIRASTMGVSPWDFRTKVAVSSCAIAVRIMAMILTQETNTITRKGNVSPFPHVGYTRVMIMTPRMTTNTFEIPRITADHLSFSKFETHNDGSIFLRIKSKQIATILIKWDEMLLWKIDHWICKWALLRTYTFCYARYECTNAIIRREE